jgi:hypothetical protein
VVEPIGQDGGKVRREHVPLAGVGKGGVPVGAQFDGEREVGDPLDDRRIEERERATSTGLEIGGRLDVVAEPEVPVADALGGAAVLVEPLQVVLHVGGRLRGDGGLPIDIVEQVEGGDQRLAVDRRVPVVRGGRQPPEVVALLVDLEDALVDLVPDAPAERGVELVAEDVIDLGEGLGDQNGPERDVALLRGRRPDGQPLVIT